MSQMKQIPPELEGEYTVRVMDMPVSTPGFVTYDEDDHANIYINARYSREKNRRTAAHELTHVLHNDIHNADPIRAVEARCQGDGSPDTPKLTPRQIRAVNTALSTLDHFLFEGFDDL